MMVMTEYSVTVVTVLTEYSVMVVMEYSVESTLYHARAHYFYFSGNTFLFFVVINYHVVQVSS